MSTSRKNKIDVDLSALHESKERIATDINDLLQSGIASARGLIFRGVPVGERSESLEVGQSRAAMAHAMKSFWQNGEAYTLRAYQMTQFLAQILEDYKDADDFAKLKLDAVIRRLDEIRNAAPPSPITGEVMFE